MAFSVVRFCVTVVGLVWSSFLCARDNGYCCNLCNCAFTYGCTFTVLNVRGVLISFWSVLLSSSAFFRCFVFRRIICLSSFAFTRAFLVFFPGRLGGLLLSPYIVARFACVGPFVCGFSSFSVCPLRVLHSTACRPTCFQLLLCQLLHLLGIQWPFQQLLRAPRLHFHSRLQSLWPTRFNSPSQLFVPAFRSDHLTTQFPAGLFPLFPALFSSIVFQYCFQLCFQLGLGCCLLTFLHCRYVEIVAILCLLSLPSLPPWALAQPAWLGQSWLRLWRHMFSRVSSHRLRFHYAD